MSFFGSININILQRSNHVRISGNATVEVWLSVDAYVDHAHQADEKTERINQLLTRGQQDKETAGFFEMKPSELFFKRNVLLLLGQKT